MLPWFRNSDGLAGILLALFSRLSIIAAPVCHCMFEGV
jgi:hypothetical protein